MPDRFRRTGGGAKAHPRKRGFGIRVRRRIPCSRSALPPQRVTSSATGPCWSAAIGLLAALLPLTPALAGGHVNAALAQAALPRLLPTDHPIVATVVLLAAILCIAAVAAILVLRVRRQAADAAAHDRDRIAALQGEVDRVHTLIQSKSQVIVAWDAATDEPEVIGDVGIVAPASAPLRVLAFGTWLAPDKARAMEAALDANCATAAKPFP